MVVHEPTLFDIAGPAHRTADPVTSVEAGRAAVGNSKLRRRILEQLQQRPSTDNELAHVLGGHPGSVAKRRHDLVVSKLVFDTGRVRPTRYGSNAIVWAVTATGRQVTP